MRGGLNAAHHGGLQLSRGSAAAQRPTAQLYVPVSLYTSIDGHPTITIEPVVPTHDFVKGCLLASKVIAFKVRSSLSLPWLSVFSPYT